MSLWQCTNPDCGTLTGPDPLLSASCPRCGSATAFFNSHAAATMPRASTSLKADPPSPVQSSLKEPAEEAVRYLFGKTTRNQFNVSPFVDHVLTLPSWIKLAQQLREAEAAREALRDLVAKAQNWMRSLNHGGADVCDSFRPKAELTGWCECGYSECTHLYKQIAALSPVPADPREQP